MNYKVNDVVLFKRTDELKSGINIEFPITLLISPSGSVMRM
jgi:hypothetical protein